MGQSQSRTDNEVTLQHIQELYHKFTSECPSGNLHLHELKKIFGDGKISFMEYVAAVNLVLRGKLEDKLKWSFKVYDGDGNGCLDRQEKRHIIRIIYKIKRLHDPGTVENTDDICDRIFEVVDKNKDSQISLEEFVKGAEKDPWVKEQLQLDIRPCDWFIEHQKKP